MGWYDLFSKWYDQSLESLYAEERAIAAKALDLAPGHTVLDLPCGTGQSLPHLAPAVLPNGRVIAADISPGMLTQAKRRVARAGWSNVELEACDVHALHVDKPVERIHVFLGLSAFPRWETAFERLWSVLASGGKMVIVDVHAEHPGPQGKLVNWIAQADISRRTWEPLEKVGVDFQKIALPQRWQHGGAIFCACANKP